MPIPWNGWTLRPCILEKQSQATMCFHSFSVSWCCGGHQPLASATLPALPTALPSLYSPGNASIINYLLQVDFVRAYYDRNKKITQDSPKCPDPFFCSGKESQALLVPCLLRFWHLGIPSQDGFLFVWVQLSWLLWSQVRLHSKQLLQRQWAGLWISGKLNKWD